MSIQRAVAMVEGASFGELEAEAYLLKLFPDAECLSVTERRGMAADALAAY